MLRSFASLLAATMVLTATPSLADPAPDQPTNQPTPSAKHSKHVAKRPHQIWHGYGYLPGYRTPERIDWENNRTRGPVWYYGSARWYHGQWNHGGFGPCWTQTPIGNVWNCGK